MFHVVNQYCDLEKLAKNEQKAALHKARKMELDYLAMIWLSIWDPRLEANVWQLQEMAMTDWFFSRTGWSNAIGVRELLTQNEVYAMDSLWDHRAKQREKENEDDAQEAEELEDWVRSGVSDAVSSRFSESGIVHH
ncbi:uncharacterized protein LOC129581027 [Paramacrobiotus metropolitanus]|uniref:uncharacterized protein LOC129581027 n=1 Tax=Paramacrobiotus metropolitanus TaxID=2943436 RepID=UPI00244580E0|nr:uncharacterized protein LOC129581027 [Paramacrobiotus metropolitanus]